MKGVLDGTSSARKCQKYFGEQIDIHAGGEDLIFPHHENETEMRLPQRFFQILANAF